MGTKSRKTSEIWNFFTDQGQHVASCNTCDKKISFKTSISNLKKHLTRRHAVILQGTAYEDVGMSTDTIALSAKELTNAADDEDTITIKPSPPTPKRNMFKPYAKRSAVIKEHLPTVPKTEESSIVVMRQVDGESGKNMDDFDAFGDYVARALRSLLNRSLVTEAKFRINNILYHIEKNDQALTETNSRTQSYVSRASSPLSNLEDVVFFGKRDMSTQLPAID